MKAKFTGKIFRISRGEAETKIEFDVLGKVDTRLVSAQETSLDAVLMIKNIIADKMIVGTTFTIILSDEEEQQGI